MILELISFSIRVSVGGCIGRNVCVCFRKRERKIVKKSKGGGERKKE